MNVLFLDIDGVLNQQTMDLSAPAIQLLNRSCIEHLNSILKETAASIVVSSSWRYTILCGEHTHETFGQMLIDHGATRGMLHVIGATAGDEDYRELTDTPVAVRGRQIRRWLVENRARLRVGRYCVLDNDDDGISVLHPESFVRVNPRVGLTAEDAERAIEILNRGS